MDLSHTRGQVEVPEHLGICAGDIPTLQCLGECEVCFPNFFTHTPMPPHCYGTVYMCI